MKKTFLLAIIVFIFTTPFAFAEDRSEKNAAVPRLKTVSKLQYPEEARLSGAEGTVILQLFIESSGEVKKVTVITSSGNSKLDEAAIEYGLGHVFEPSRDKNGNPFKSIVRKTVSFALEKTKSENEPYNNKFKVLPRMTYKEKFKLPEELRAITTEFRAVVKFFIDEKGKVTSVLLAKSSGFESFDEAVIKNAYKCKFSPAIDLDGNPAKCAVIKVFTMKKKTFNRAGEIK